MEHIRTVIAPVNIAVIKYWGKRDEELILPLNDSVSATLDLKSMCAKTTVSASAAFNSNEIWLNGKKESFDNKRIQNCINAIKRRAAIEKSVPTEFLDFKIRICSENNFPTAAGLASSAAGYACLAVALAKLFKIKSEVGTIARIGSGSACRSTLGGFVQWNAGTLPDGTDSTVTQIAAASHWPEMRILILIVDSAKKKVGSTRGMQLSNTSELLKYRVEKVVPKRVKDITQAIKEKNFPLFAELTMKDSNQFHAVCLDTFPPCVYMNDVSHSIVELVHKYNDMQGELKVAYTFDAGPNACLYLLDAEVPKFLSAIKYVYPTLNLDIVKEFIIQEECSIDTNKLSIQPQKENVIKDIIFSRIGNGPEEITDGSHLLNSNGEPINS